MYQFKIQKLWFNSLKDDNDKSKEKIECEINIGI